MADLYMGFQVENSFVHPSLIGAEIYYRLEENEIVPHVEPQQVGTPLGATAMFFALATRALAAVLEDLAPELDELADQIQSIIQVELVLPTPPAEARDGDPAEG